MMAVEAAEAPRSPATPTEVVTDTLHGVAVLDSYRWLEEQQSPATRAWISEQNTYTRSVLDALPGRERLRHQFEALYQSYTPPGPTVRKNRYFFLRQRAGEGQPSIVVREGATGRDRVLVDAGRVSTDGSASVTLLHVSDDGRIVAWGRRNGGEDQREIFFLDSETGETHADYLPRAIYYSVFVLPDRSGFLYSRRSSQGTRILEHRFGMPPAQDQELFGSGIGDNRIIWTQFSEDGRFVAAFVSDGNTKTQVYVLDRARRGTVLPLITDVPAEFDGVFGGHTLYLNTSWNAPNYRVLAIEMNKPSPENWREVIPNSPDRVISMVRAAGRKLLVRYIRNATNELAVFDPDGKRMRDVALPTTGAAYLWPATRWDSNEVFYYFSSFALPGTLYQYDVASGRQSLWFRKSLPVNSDSIRTSQIWYRSKDGTRVPMFVVTKKGTKLDGRRPVLLTGYGAYGAVQMPYFEPFAAAWVENGGVFALANIRGGGEFGEKWHRDGMLDKKQNSFDDFIAAAEWLIANRYTRPDKLAIKGVSNGGMLVAVVAMQRPNLFRAVVSAHAHLDMLRFHKFLQAAPWTREYGNPEVAEDFAYLRKYSPYHQVREGVLYPAMLFTTGDNDTRVAPLHAR
ncbi:MAG: S9 family peptidase, partial [Pyrinomonadaceae bacterium]|nr:S9 family peptidase [Pyrinomonadaceae bacterium]